MDRRPDRGRRRYLRGRHPRGHGRRRRLSGSRRRGHGRRRCPGRWHRRGYGAPIVHDRRHRLGAHGGPGWCCRTTSVTNLTVTANGAFVFATPVASGATLHRERQDAADRAGADLPGRRGLRHDRWRQRDQRLDHVRRRQLHHRWHHHRPGRDWLGPAEQRRQRPVRHDERRVRVRDGRSHAGDAFAVTIKTQPSAPAQTCVVSQGSGTAATGNVTTVAVSCTTNTYAVGGTVTGLTRLRIGPAGQSRGQPQRDRRGTVHLREGRRQRRRVQRDSAHAAVLAQPDVRGHRRQRAPSAPPPSRA